MIELNQYGILPVGIHEMGLEEIERLFGNPTSSYRSRLFEKLKKYVERLRILQLGIALIVDGSFIMSCVEMPADIDIVLVMPEEWEKTIEEIPPEHYNSLSSIKIEKEFGFNLFVVSEHSPEHHGWIRFFSNIKGDWHFSFDIPEDVMKGLVRITL